MEPIGCPETSVGNHHYTMRNNPEERDFQPLPSGSLKSPMDPFSEKFIEVYQIEMLGFYYS
jgi:hypothetical protein